MKLQLTLRKRLVLLVVSAMVPLLGLSVFNAEVDSAAAISRATDNLNFAVSLAVSNQQQVTETAHQVLIAMTHLPGIREGNNTHCDRHLKELTRQLPSYANLGIASAQGHVLCSGVAGSPPVYVGDRSYFRDAVASRDFVAGEYILGRMSGKPSVAFALPMLDAKGSVSFVAFAAFDLARMAASLAAVQLPAGAGLGIHDRHGTLLAASPGLPLQVGQKAASPVMQEAVRTRSASVREGPDKTGQQRLWVYRPTSPDALTAFVVAVSMDRRLVVGPSQDKLWLELAGLALVALLGGWLAWVL
ncbi:MAG: sensor signal transduction histidine kinase, partial [Polaromonas sp.]|nr:sensor signal transduction histidine kinase [Polaromonas sp.]